MQLKNILKIKSNFFYIYFNIVRVLLVGLAQRLDLRQDFV